MHCVNVLLAVFRMRYQHTTSNQHTSSLPFSFTEIFKCQIQRTVLSPGAFNLYSVLACVGASFADTGSAHYCKVPPCILQGTFWTKWRNRDCRTTENHPGINFCERGDTSRRAFIDLRPTLITFSPSTEDFISLSLINHA